MEQYFESQYDQDGTFTFEFAPCAKLKLSVHNLSCIDENDQIIYRINWLTGNETNNFVNRTGCFQFDGDYFQLPTREYIYEWEVTKNGITTSYDSVFTLVENQVSDFTINY